ncbi:MAG TPA: hypothetical protein PKE06_00065 [Flavilitoribacter sp.]|nr:hypothetical protein [Flavilitoribacter sp.]HMQ86260.1 hypothetical protein [Flavilitoribacter sp.]
MKASYFKCAFGAALLIVMSSCQKNEDFSPADTQDAKLDLRNSVTPTLYASSNTSGTLGIFDLTFPGSPVQDKSTVAYADADGVAYIPFMNAVFQLDRTNNRLKVYGNANTLGGDDEIMPNAMSNPDFNNGREITVGFTNRVVVAQDAGPGNNNTNGLLVYRTSTNSIQLYRSYTTSINLWGIQAVGNDLFAVVDNSNTLAMFAGFFGKKSGALEPDAIVTIGGLVRTHGLSYDPATDIMVLTDIADAASATDGGIHVITNFMSKFMEAANGSGVIPADQQIRIAGANTLLGNPVDVAFDSSTDMIYVAERANGGGRILGFTTPAANGNPMPVFDMAFAGASAVALNK